METFKFSKRGDQGQTSLLTGERVSKASLRPEAYGTLDEASSALGLAKVFTANESIRQMIDSVQQDLLTLGAVLASEPGEGKAHHLGPERVPTLEGWIEELQKKVPIQHRFIHPGGNAVSAAVDLARAIIRRGERRVVAIKEADELAHPQILTYLNRLADFLFVLARYAEREG